MNSIFKFASLATAGLLAVLVAPLALAVIVLTVLVCFGMAIAGVAWVIMTAAATGVLGVLAGIVLGVFLLIDYLVSRF